MLLYIKYNQRQRYKSFSDKKIFPLYRPDNIAPTELNCKKFDDLIQKIELKFF